jgi:hypothetical protein
MSWYNTIFGNLPPQPIHPASRGATFGANYQALPDTRLTIEDQRPDAPPDIAAAMRHGFYDPNPPDYWADKYAPSLANASRGPGFDPMLYAANDPHFWTDDGQGSYRASFPQNWRSPVPTQAPYRNSPVGPNLPRSPVGTSVDPEMPYMGAHLPISPGDPGWTPPPSPSGPHNPQGDLTRPGYDNPAQMPQSAISPQQLQNALQYWQGGAQ